MAGLRTRLGGLFCLAVAIAIGWYFIWRPLLEAQAHAAEVRYSLKAFVLVPMAGVFGLFFLLVGDSVSYRDEERQRFTAMGWLLFAVAALAGGLGFWWFKAQFAALGYSG